MIRRGAPLAEHSDMASIASRRSPCVGACVVTILGLAAARDALPIELSVETRALRFAQMRLDRNTMTALVENLTGGLWPSRGPAELSRRSGGDADSRPVEALVTRRRRGPTMTRAFGLLALGVALFAAPSWCAAQRVQDLTGPGLTADSLEKVLTPYSHSRGMVLDSRGIVLKPPDCSHFREASSRGIELVPAADIAAITVQFASNSAALTPDAKKTLDTLGQALNSADLKPCCFEIEGHTDNVGNRSYNLRLSKRRAQSVIAYLVEHAGQDEHRMLAVGFGPSKPLADNQTDAGRAKNRRVQVVNLGYGSSGK